MKCVLFLISVLLLSVAIDAKNLVSNFLKIKESMKIKESIKALPFNYNKFNNIFFEKKMKALERCYKNGRSGSFSVDVAYYRSESNPTVKGNYINVEPYALGNDKALTKTIYKFNCRKPEFASTGLCQQIAQEKDGSECTKCFGTDEGYMKKEVQMMNGGILTNGTDTNRDGNMKITLTIICTKIAGYAGYTYVVEDPTRRRRLLTKSRREGDCRL